MTFWRMKSVVARRDRTAKNALVPIVCFDLKEVGGLRRFGAERAGRDTECPINTALRELVPPIWSTNRIEPICREPVFHEPLPPNVTTSCCHTHVNNVTIARQRV